MRPLLMLGLGVFVLASVSMVSARWAGQTWPRAELPLPDAANCWDSLCPFQQDEQTIFATLEGHPAAAAVNGYRRGEGRSSSLTLSFDYAAPNQQRLPLVLTVANDSYVLSIDYRSRNRAPLARVGDIVAALGPPDSITSQGTRVTLGYSDRFLILTVTPPSDVRDRYAFGDVYVTPDSPVISITVDNPRRPRNRGQLYYPIAAAWQGFGLYHLR